MRRWRAPSFAQSADRRRAGRRLSPGPSTFSREYASRLNAMERPDETRIIAAVLDGEVEYFRILVERYQRSIYSLMRRHTGSAATAEDLTQDVFIQVYEKLHTFKPSRRFFPWLYTIALNRCRDHLRRRGVRRQLFAAEPENQPLPDPNGARCTLRAECVLEVRQVAAAIARLPAGYGEPLLLYYREGFSVKEIAKATGMSTAATKARIHRGRELLRDALGANDETT